MDNNDKQQTPATMWLCRFAAWSFLLVLSHTDIQAAELFDDGPVDHNDPLFADDRLLDITLRGPFTTINREREEDKEYEGGSLAYSLDGQGITLEAKFEVRGNFRLRNDICDYAQLWVALDKDKVAGTLFANQNRLKLAVQCRDSSPYQRYIVREHQAYQFFNLLSDINFQARLVNVTYQDTERDLTRSHLGIFLEHKDRVAYRNRLVNVDLNSIAYRTLDPQQANLVDIFMLMIANTDYSIISAPEDECCHNTKLFRPAGEERFFPAPYDFDSSGYVDAHYAEPSRQLRIRSVRQRLYRGFCFPREVLDTTLADFRQREPQIMAIAGDTTWVNTDDAEDSVAYLQEFFDIINDPEELEDEIIEECRG